MSIMVCDSCTRHIDTDFELMNEWYDKYICDVCYEDKDDIMDNPSRYESFEQLSARGCDAISLASTKTLSDGTELRLFWIKNYANNGHETTAWIRV